MLRPASAAVSLCVVALVAGGAVGACSSTETRGAAGDAGAFRRPDASGLDPGGSDDGDAGVLLGAGTSSSGGGDSGGGPGPARSARLVVNEVDYDEVGTDDREFVELFN